jgi:hypothetical protein
MGVLVGPYASKGPTEVTQRSKKSHAWEEAHEAGQFFARAKQARGYEQTR